MGRGPKKKGGKRRGGCVRELVKKDEVEWVFAQIWNWGGSRMTKI